VATAIGRHRATAPVGELENGLAVLARLLDLAVPAEEGAGAGPAAQVPDPACACLESGRFGKPVGQLHSDFLSFLEPRSAAPAGRCPSVR
jgi:hypothetical protein